MTGRLVITLPLGDLPAGQHTVRWDGRSASGANVASGVYWMRLHGAGAKAVAKALLVR
ncbi:MAG: hypothetical protein KDC10_10895 [Calditrichaeota bacterium]|nr:hypothetical protein [Calditrichota bacterium]